MTLKEAMQNLALLIAAKEGCRAEVHNNVVQFKGTIGRDRKAKSYWINVDDSIFSISESNYKNRFEGNYNTLVEFISTNIR